MNILVIASNNYPSYSEPQKGTFVYKIVQEFSKLNHNVTVFAPEKYFANKLYTVDSYGEEKAYVLRPKFLSLSNMNLFGFNTYHISRRSLGTVLQKSIKKKGVQVDLVYAHFLSNGLIASESLVDLQAPIVVAVGEYKNIDIIKSYYSKDYYYSLIKKIKGFVAVSNQVKDKLIELGIATTANCLVAPNGVNLDVFRPADNKTQLRIDLGLPVSKKIILFVGRFLHNKGPQRIINALEKLKDENYIGVFLGIGDPLSDSPYIFYKGSVVNKQVANYMAAADVFVLPTLHEGSSNVIVEAMACGLPIVSSAIPEIEEQCDNSFSILVDPLDENQIAEAIDIILKNDNKHILMSAAARKHAHSFDLSTRAEKILNFINHIR